MYRKTILGVVVVIALIVGSFVVWKVNTPEAIQTPVEQNTPSVDQVALSQLKADLQGITPHFIDVNKGNAQLLTREEQKIKNDVVNLLSAGQPDNREYYSGLRLDAVGKRYILVSQPSAESSHDEVIDSQTGKVLYIPEERAYYLGFEGRDIALYISTQAIYTYTLGHAGAVLVSRSQLSGNETYHTGESDFQLEPEQTHTKDSITISVFDSSQIVQNPDALAQPTAMQTMNKKVRKITLSF